MSVFSGRAAFFSLGNTSEYLICLKELFNFPNADPLVVSRESSTCQSKSLRLLRSYSSACFPAPLISTVGIVQLLNPVLCAHASLVMYEVHISVFFRQISSTDIYFCQCFAYVDCFIILANKMESNAAGITAECTAFQKRQVHCNT